MGLISKPTTYAAGGTVSAANLNALFDTIYDEFNGNISAANLEDEAVTTTKINDGAVTAAKLSADAAQAAYPVGSVFISVVATSPATLFGFGTWAAFAAGKMLVGLDAADADFDTAEETGGAKTKDLSHTHAGTTGNANTLTGQSGTDQANSLTQQHTHDFTTGVGGSATQNVMNPYVVVYMWKRTA